MDIHRLEVFCKVVELGSFTKAAETVFLSQPTVSEHIRSLEERLDQKLIDRMGRIVMPTQAGQILYKYARRLIHLRDEAEQAIVKYSGKLAGNLLLGASTIPGTYILPSYVGTFYAKFPGIRITIKISDSRQVAHETMNGDTDLGVVGARWKDSGLIWEEMFADELVLVVPSGHRWTKKKAIALDALREEPFILRENDSGTRKVTAEILGNNGFDISDLTVVAEMGSTEAVRQSIKAGIGASIISRRAVEDDLERGILSAVPIKGIDFHRPFYLIRHKKRHPSPLCSVFLDELHAENKNL